MDIPQDPRDTVPPRTTPVFLNTPAVERLHTYRVCHGLCTPSDSEYMRAGELALWFILMPSRTLIDDSACAVLHRHTDGHRTE